uniref:protein-serine/threonine phosphatase n=1 Tax=Gossypium raimondii TaxID=29730 RepID=A0A0D2TV28_GOSRA|nr:hypothetical protein B456_013G049000 [Gossypium raimondii]
MMMMLRSLSRPLERCLGVRAGGDALMWHADLKPHASGDFSIAVVQANNCLEDQSQVFASPFATYVGVYDGHGGPEASRFVNKHLFPFLHKFATEQGGLSADVIKKAFNATEEEFLRLVKRSLPVRPQIASVGSCCLVGAISNDVLYVANLGDSRAGIAKRLVRAAIQEVAKKREMRYSDIKKIEKGIRRHFHDDITVIVIYLDKHRGSSRNKRTKQNAMGCTMAPVDIYSFNADGGDEDLLQTIS